MEISSQAIFYSPIPLPGGAMFHRCCPGKRPTLTAPASANALAETGN
jgi:hypothetical protein